MKYIFASWLLPISKDIVCHLNPRLVILNDKITAQNQLLFIYRNPSIVSNDINFIINYDDTGSPIFEIGNVI